MAIYFFLLDEIQDLFDSLGTNLNLSEGKSSPYVFIIDKELNLRGRNDDKDFGILYGFNSQSVAEINKMVDDLKVILAEYRRALKSTISTRMNKSYKYTGLVIIIIFFGLIFIPKFLID